MTNCGACDLGIAHEHVHPAVFLYGSARPGDAARYWHESAIESAKEANRLRDELRIYKDSKIHQWLESVIRRYKND